MKYIEIPELEGNEYFRDVNEWVFNIIFDGLKKCKMEKRLIFWDDLRAYALEFFTLPEITIDNAIKQARDKLDL